MRKDILLSSFIGFAVAASLLLISGNLGLELPYLPSILVVFPILSALGMMMTRLMARRVPLVLQASKFLLVGALNTFVDLGVLNLLIFVSQASSGSLFVAFKGISFLLAVINSYAWNKFWTFSAGKRVSGKEFTQFLVVSAIGFGINVGTATAVVNVVGPQFGVSGAIWANFGALTAAFASLLWNFLGYKFVVFKQQ